MVYCGRNSSKCINHAKASREVRALANFLRSRWYEQIGTIFLFPCFSPRACICTFQGREMFCHKIDIATFVGRFRRENFSSFLLLWTENKAEHCERLFLSPSRRCQTVSHEQERCYSRHIKQSPENCRKKFPCFTNNQKVLPSPKRARIKIRNSNSFTSPSPLPFLSGKKTFIRVDKDRGKTS